MVKAKLQSRMLLQVHDELIFEVAKGELEQLTELVRKEMGGAYPLKAPLDVNVGVGKSWDEAAHWPLGRVVAQAFFAFPPRPGRPRLRLITRSDALLTDFV